MNYDGLSLVIGYGLLVIGCWLLLLVIAYGLIGYWRLWVMGYWLLVIVYWLLVMGYCLCAMGYWLWALGYWLWVIIILHYQNNIKVYIKNQKHFSPSLPLSEKSTDS